MKRSKSGDNKEDENLLNFPTHKLLYDKILHTKNFAVEEVIKLLHIRVVVGK